MMHDDSSHSMIGHMHIYAHELSYAWTRTLPTYLLPLVVGAPTGGPREVYVHGGAQISLWDRTWAVRSPGASLDGRGCAQRLSNAVVCCCR